MGTLDQHPHLKLVSFPNERPKNFSDLRSEIAYLMKETHTLIDYRGGVVSEGISSEDIMTFPLPTRKLKEIRDRLRQRLEDRNSKYRNSMFVFENLDYSPSHLRLLK